jgi:hypothetical protein
VPLHQGEGEGGGEEEQDFTDLEAKEAAMSASGVKDVLSRMPIPASEASRMQAVAEAGLEGDDANDLAGGS